MTRLITRLILLISLVIYIKTTLSDTLGIIDYENDSERNLYITNPLEATHMASIMYLVDGPFINNHEIEVFKYFSKKIGRNNGGVFLAINSNKSENKIYSPQEYMIVIDFMTKSACNFVQKRNSYIIFEIVKNKKCYYYDLKEGFDLAIALSKIRKKLKNVHKDKQEFNDFFDINNFKVESYPIYDSK